MPFIVFVVVFYALLAWLGSGYLAVALGLGLGVCAFSVWLWWGGKYHGRASRWWSALTPLVGTTLCLALLYPFSSTTNGPDMFMAVLVIGVGGAVFFSAIGMAIFLFAGVLPASRSSLGQQQPSGRWHDLE
ncbi:hypothetical protein [Agromyces bracchium]|uniref:Uncharacterized protein n=1 Tax=Agromyces bracchium TaxID=88376 RepID=A0A6I3M8X4_9MICO|nr:hypothetical protein [Agromyces bracchium]MTH69431.1 hypothetical protein [Agromyces bracchium]